MMLAVVLGILLLTLAARAVGGAWRAGWILIAAPRHGEAPGRAFAVDEGFLKISRTRVPCPCCAGQAVPDIPPRKVTCQR